MVENMKLSETHPLYADALKGTKDPEKYPCRVCRKVLVKTPLGQCEQCKAKIVEGSAK